MLDWIRDRFSRKRRWPGRELDRVGCPFPGECRFPRLLSETRRWCNMPGRLDPRTSLRTPQLMPWVFGPSPAWIVHHVAHQRRYRLEERDGGAPYRSSTPPPAEGRFLVHYPGLNLTDGAAELASDGFFDPWNLPPWDTWIVYGSRPTRPDGASWSDFLICWVPQQLVAHAEIGIVVNPEQCIDWLDDGQVDRMLADAGMR